MFEYGIHNVNTNEREIIFGYSVKDAFRRNARLNPDEWDIDYAEYID